MAVVGADQGDSRLPMDVQKARIHLLLLRDAVVLQLQIIIPPTKQRVIPQGAFLCRRVIAVEQQLLHLPRQTGGKTHQPLMMLLQQVPVHPGLVVKPLGKAGGAELDQVPVALHAFAQEDQMEGVGIQLIDPVKARPRRHIKLAADDGLDAGLFCRLVKIHAAIHDAVVRDGAGRLPQLLEPLHQRVDAAGAVQKAVFRM